MSIDLVAIFGDPTSPAVPSGETSGAVVATEEPETLEARQEAEAEREAIVWAETAPAAEVHAALRAAIDGFEKLYRGGAKQDLAAVAAPRPRPAVPVAVVWPAAAADFCLLLAPDDLPPVPFRPNAWTEVRDAGKFLRWLQADIRRGPSGPRAFYGALQADLQALQRFALQASDRRQQDGMPPR